MVRPNLPNRQISLTDYRALAEFRYRVRQFLRITERTARQAGVHPQQHRLMLAVKGMPAGMAPSISNLAERLQLEPHSTVELVNRAATRGLVARHHDRHDRRVVMVRVTPRGEGLLAQLSLRNRQELRAAAPALMRALRAITRERAA